MIGDAARAAYNFVEFEGAEPNSMFRRQGGKHAREWSAPFNHGYSQIIDWFCKLRDMSPTSDFGDRFGTRPIDFMGTLVVGRAAFLEAGEPNRLAYRRQHVVVESRKIHVVTYDELLTDLSARLDILAALPPLRRRAR